VDNGGADSASMDNGSGPVGFVFTLGLERILDGLEL
jgi:hypothetical protein